MQGIRRVQYSLGTYSTWYLPGMVYYQVPGRQITLRKDDTASEHDCVIRTSYEYSYLINAVSIPAELWSLPMPLERRLCRLSACAQAMLTSYKLCIRPCLAGKPCRSEGVKICCPSLLCKLAVVSGVHLPPGVWDTMWQPRLARQCSSISANTFVDAYALAVPGVATSCITRINRQEDCPPPVAAQYRSSPASSVAVGPVTARIAGARSNRSALAVIGYGLRNILTL